MCEIFSLGKHIIYFTDGPIVVINYIRRRSLDTIKTDKKKTNKNLSIRLSFFLHFHWTTAPDFSISSVGNKSHEKS